MADDKFGVADANEPIEPAPGQKGTTAMHESIQRLRQDIRDGKVAYTEQREDKEAVATIEKGLEAEDSDEGAESEEELEQEGGDEAGEQGEAEGDEAGEAEGDEAGEAEGTADEEKLRVSLRGRNPDDTPIDFIAPDEESAERLRQNARDGLRRDEFNRRIERVAQREEDVAYVNHRLKHDPAGFLIERIPGELHEDVIERLLVQPGMLEKISAKLEELENPDRRETARTRLENESLRKSGKIDEDFENDAVARKATRVLMDTCDTLAGAVDADVQHQFVDDLLRDVQQYYIRENRGTPMTPEEIVKVAAPRLKLYGLTPDKALGLVNGDPSPIPKAKPDKAAADRLKQSAQNGARKLVRASAGRKAAASVAGAGTPAPARPTAPPKGQGLTDRFAWVRSQLGLSKKGR